MSESVKLYGFGSFFSRLASKPRDVDILIVHERNDPPSIDFAIHCKAMFENVLPVAHFTILSESEERELRFVQQTSAQLLGRVTDVETEAQFAMLASRLSTKRVAQG